MTDVARVRPSMRGIWFGLTVGPPAWLVHIVGQGAFVRYACNDGGAHWWLHVLTVVTAVPTAAGLAICLAAFRRIPDSEGAATPAGRTRFLAGVGALVAAISLALILLEGSYVLFISSCA
jgi:hypothetical protein